ncbi:ABC transporter permease [Neoaquamicrobium sediminum]|uniref:ABC transporter permease n=1 Tax=Neoaquamicrobium sediminum TaxID=1849104 RepID=UPI001565BCF5|nr:ABC transporter permease [Mesorhizobium sediminum]NRC53381.1 ABC transporter permease [Mesorhizobium sediminum]
MKRLLAVYFVLLVGFLILPLIFLVPISLSASQFLEFPPTSLSLRWYAAFFEDPTWVGAAILSFRVGIGATALSLVVGTLASIALVRGNFPGKSALTAIFIAPLILPTVVLALALYIVFLRWQLVDNVFALTLAHAIVALPYVVMIVSASLRRFDTTIERAARVLGAGPIKAFMLVTLPYLVPSMFAAGILAFFASFDELIITLFVSGGAQTLPVRIWNDLGLKLDPTVPAVAVMLTMLSIVGMGIGEVIRRRNEQRYQSATPPEA